MFDLSGRVAVVTGSTKGIGLSIAQQMCSLGAKVVVSSRSAEASEAVARNISSSWAREGGAAIGVACDVGDKNSLYTMLDTALAQWGRINTLVLNAGVSPFRGSMREMPEESFDLAMTVNLKSPIWACNKVCPQMADLGGGSVIVISSVGGLRATTTLGAYAISKAADMQLVRNLAAEWGPKNIRANCIAPGLIKTEFARRLWEDPILAEKAVAGYLLGRFGRPEDVSGVAVMLASEAGSFITGQTIVVDGGSTIKGPY